MARRAEWRARRHDPRSWLGWLAQDGARPLWLVADRIAWALRVGVAVSAVRGDWGSAWVCFLSSTMPETIQDSLSRTRFIRALPVGSLLTLPPVDTPYPCRIEVRKGGALLGSDVGVVTFVDGWLCYEGHRTSFAVCRADTKKRDDDRIDLIEGGAVEFFPQDRLKALGIGERNLRKRFRANLESWWRSDAPEGRSVLPPSTPHLTGLARAKIDLVVSLAVVGLGAELVLSYATTWSILLAPLVYGLVIAVRNLFWVTVPDRVSPAVE